MLPVDECLSAVGARLKGESKGGGGREVGSFVRCLGGSPSSRVAGWVTGWRLRLNLLQYNLKYIRLSP